MGLCVLCTEFIGPGVKGPSGRLLGPLIGDLVPDIIVAWPIRPSLYSPPRSQCDNEIPILT